MRERVDCKLQEGRRKTPAAHKAVDERRGADSDARSIATLYAHAFSSTRGVVGPASCGEFGVFDWFESLPNKSVHPVSRAAKAPFGSPHRPGSPIYP